MKVLVTGAFGYIGCSLVKTFLELGWKVAALVRSVPAYANELAKNIEILQTDITKSIKPLPGSFELCVHLAGANDIDSRDPDMALKATTSGTRNVLQFCKESDIKRLIYFSTFQVYGIAEGDIDESVEPDPRNDYGATHLFAEQYIKMYERIAGIHSIILRPTNVYGAPYSRYIDRWTLVPGCFCKELSARGTITLKTSGRQLRDFISLAEISEITARICKEFTTFDGGVFNLCRGEAVSIIDVAKLTIDVYEKMYGEKCELRILSDQPSTQVPLNVTSALDFNSQNRLGIDMLIRQEIENIFKLLKG